MDILERLEARISERRQGDPDQSYVAQLRARGRPVMARKVGEEAVELAIASLTADDAETTAEAADLVFHLLCLLADRDIAFDRVCEELARREGLSGLEEKASRSS